MGIKTSGMKLTFNGTLTCTSGVGSSAANCVALSRAMSTILEGYTNEDINTLAYHGESISHGQPSGIDNTASTYGGMLSFTKNSNGDPIFDRILKNPDVTFHFVYASTGITASTTKVVQSVFDLKQQDPKYFSAIQESYNCIVRQGMQALKDGDLKTIGDLMLENHTLLDQIGVSCPELDNLVQLAMNFGALGAKMTGTGRGGLVIVLAADEDAKHFIADQLKTHAPYVWTA